MKKLMMIAAAVVVLAVATVAIGGAATAQEGDGDGPLGSFLAKVAGKLGVTESELQTAIDEARTETIDEAVAGGRLTEEQAERLREGGFPFHQRSPEEGRPHPRPGVCRQGADFVLKATAQVLDVPVGQVVEEVKQGKSLAQVAEAQGMAVEEFKVALVDQIQIQLDEMVAEGDLTQERAERIFQRIEEYIDRIVNAHPNPGGPCHRRHGAGPLEAPEAEEASEVTA